MVSRITPIALAWVALGLVGCQNGQLPSDGAGLTPDADTGVVLDSDPGSPPADGQSGDQPADASPDGSPTDADPSDTPQDTDPGGTPSDTDPGSDPVSGPTLAGCPMFPVDNIWNTAIDTLPVSPSSPAYISSIGATRGLHADFGSGLWDGGPIGIPYIVVDGSQTKVAVTFDYDDESDHGLYPAPPDAPIEGGAGSSGDRHVLIVDRTNRILYELYSAYPQPDGTWHAGSGAIFDLTSNTLRPDGWTSCDAAGLPILPGLVRYDEVTAGEIKHAIRFTVQTTRKAYVWPARHHASSNTSASVPPMGQRFRLKAGFDVSGYPAGVQVILKAMKKYGLIVADNGSNWYISGAPDERWDNDELATMRNVKGSDFEAVDVASLMVNPDSGQANVSVPAPVN